MTEYEDYKKTAIDSLRTAVELFNRPFDAGRTEAVLILLDHSFEQLLKAAILRRGGNIRRDDGSGQTISNETCIKRLRDGTRDNQRLQVLSDPEAVSLFGLNNLRDFAQHEQVGISEKQLYLQCRQATDVFEKILNNVFNESLSDNLPERVLPLSTTLPVDISSVIESETEEIKSLLEEDSDSEARNRLKAIDAIERGIEDDGVTPGREELDAKLESLDSDQGLEDVFPSTFSALTDSVEAGGGQMISLGGNEGIPATYVPDEEIDEDDDVYLFTEKNIHGRYPFNPMQFKNQVHQELDEDSEWSDITLPKLKTLMIEIGIWQRDEYHQSEIPLGAGDTRPGYSPSAVDRIVEAIEEDPVDVMSAWNSHKHEFGF